MRVGFDVSKVFGPGDGVARYSVSLLEAIAQEAEERGGAPALHLYSMGAATDSRAWKRLLDELPGNVRRGPGQGPRRRDVDLLHVLSFSDPARFDGPLVFTVHDLTFLTHPEFHVPENRNHCLLGTLRALAMGATVVAVSEATAEEVDRWFVLPEARLRVVYEAASTVFAVLRGDELETARRRVAERFGLDGPFVLSVGSLEPRKNIARLVEAYAGLESELRKRTPLVLVGSGGWKRDAVMAGAWPEFVQHLGAVEEDDLVALYNVASVVAYPSLVEGFGLPVVEAMACGTPVLTSNTSSLAEVGADAALCVDPLDVTAIRRGLESLLSDSSLRRRYRHAGLARAGEFCWRKAAAQMIDIYGEVVAAAAAAAGSAGTGSRRGRRAALSGQR